MGAGTAFANPIMGDWLYIDFDPPNFAHDVYPALFEVVDAYVMFSQPDFLWDGLTSVSFALSLTPGMGDSPSFTPLLPGGMAVGEWYTGITVASTECVAGRTSRSRSDAYRSSTRESRAMSPSSTTRTSPGGSSTATTPGRYSSTASTGTGASAGQASVETVVSARSGMSPGAPLSRSTDSPAHAEKTERPPDAVSVGWPLRCSTRSRRAYRSRTTFLCTLFPAAFSLTK